MEGLVDDESLEDVRWTVRRSEDVLKDVEGLTINGVLEMVLNGIGGYLQVQVWDWLVFFRWIKGDWDNVFVDTRYLSLAHDARTTLEQGTDYFVE